MPSNPHTPPSLATITVHGQPFHCRCGANLLNAHGVIGSDEVYTCNACGTAYKIPTTELANAPAEVAVDDPDDDGYTVIVQAFGLNAAAREALFDRIADAAHELDEPVFCSGDPEPSDRDTGRRPC